jgi:hypothetical protein
MPEALRHAGRNGAIWREHCRGATQEALAIKYDLSNQRVAQIIAAVRGAIPQQERAELVAQEVDHMRDVRTEIMELWDGDPVPVTQRVGEGWEYVRAPDGGEIAMDHGGRLHAVRLALEYTKQMHRVLGLESATRVDVGISEEAAASRAAAEALAQLHGGTGEG